MQERIRKKSLLSMGPSYTGARLGAESGIPPHRVSESVQGTRRRMRRRTRVARRVVTPHRRFSAVCLLEVSPSLLKLTYFDCCTKLC